MSGHFTLTYSFEVDRELSVASLRDGMTHATHDGYRGLAKELLVVADKEIGKAH